MCRFCDWEQALTDIGVLVGSDLHILDEAQLARLKSKIEKTRHATPMQKKEIRTLEAFDPEDDEKE